MRERERERERERVSTKEKERDTGKLRFMAAGFFFLVGSSALNWFYEYVPSSTESLSTRTQLAKFLVLG